MFPQASAVLDLLLCALLMNVFVAYACIVYQRFVISNIILHSVYGVLVLAIPGDLQDSQEIKRRAVALLLARNS